MREEIIDYLIRHNLDINEESINRVMTNGFGFTDINNVLTYNPKFDINTINNIYNYITNLMMENVEKRKRLEKLFSDTANSSLERFNYLNRAIANATEELRSAQVLEKNMSGYVKTISLDFSDKSIINNEVTSAIVSDGVVIGSIKKGFSSADKSSIRIKNYTFSALSAFVKEEGNITPARIEKINENGIGYLASADENIINSSSAFRLIAETSSPNEKEIDLIIDKGDQEYFNQIEIKLVKAHLASVYISKDGIEYEKVVDKPRYIKDTIIPVEGNNSRYVKFTFYKNSFDHNLGGKYLYRILIDELNILESTLNETAVFETNNLSLTGNYSSISIDTCDTFSNRNCNIQYSISIDDGNWQLIRPVDKHKPFKVLEPIALNINGYTDNKLISLTEFNKSGSGYVSSLTIPDEFLLSNEIRVFSEDITNTNTDWNYDGRYYSAFGLLLETKTIDLGSTLLEINGKWATGSITLGTGLYKIRTYSEGYVNLFNPKKAKLVSSINGEYTVQEEDGTVRSIIDPLYPFNHKILVDSTFDFIFKKELIEKKEYTLYNNNTGFNIATTALHSEIIIVYKLHTSNANSFKLRAELTSLNKTTIPYIEKAIIRLA